MKKLSFKTKILSLTLVAGVTATAGALTLNGYEKEVLAEDTAVFQMENSVRLRLNGNGLAFSAKMDGAKYNEIKNDENKSLYFIVMPSMYLNNVKTDNGYDYSRAIVRDVNGVFDKEASHCLYVNASEAIFQKGEEYYALGGVSDVLEQNRKLDFTAVACIETKTGSSYEYEYATYPDGKTQMPIVSLTKTLSKSVLYATTDYSTQINEHYNWFGTGEYALTIETTEDYKALVGKINDGADLSGMDLRINSGVDKTQATLNPGLALPATQTTYSTVKFYDDDGKTLLASADVNNGGNVQLPTTPTKAATEGYTYTFEKWVTEKGGDVAASFENITENMSVYAKYTAVKNKITITWKKNESDVGITETYNRGDMPQYKGETLKNYFEGDKYYICKGFGNIVPAEDDTTYVCSWEEHAGKLVTLSSRFGPYLRTDIAIDVPTEDKPDTDNQLVFKGTSTKTGGEVDFNVTPFYSKGESVLNFIVEYNSTFNEAIEFNDAVAVYKGEYIGIKDGTILGKTSGTWFGYKWHVIESMLDVSGLDAWRGPGNNWFKTNVAKDGNEDATISFDAVSSSKGNISFDVLVHQPSAESVIAFRIDYAAEEGEIITFNNSRANYNTKHFYFADGMQMIYKGGKWYVAKTAAITGVWYSNFMKTDIAKGDFTSNSDEILTFSATSSVNGAVSFQVLAHHPGEAEFVLFRIDYGTSDDYNNSYVLTEGDIITFDNAVVDFHGINIIPLVSSCFCTIIPKKYITGATRAELNLRGIISKNSALRSKCIIVRELCLFIRFWEDDSYFMNEIHLR